MIRIKQKHRLRGSSPKPLANILLMVSSLDYIFHLAVEMHSHGLPWTKEEPSQTRSPLTEDADTQISSTEQFLNTVPRYGRSRKVPTDVKDGNAEGSRKGKRGRSVDDKGANEEESMSGSARKRRRRNPLQQVDGDGSGTRSEHSTKRGPGRPKKNV